MRRTQSELSFGSDSHSLIVLECREAFLFNTITPMIGILNRFVHKDYRDLLEIQIFSEVQQEGIKSERSIDDLST